MAEPSTAWKEKIAAGEEQRFARNVERLSALQKEKSATLGTGRALHRKQIVALHGELEVFADIPAYARAGLFAKPGTYEARVRLSNGGAVIRGDRAPDIRGFALKVIGVEGPDALGEGVALAQDLVMINRETFGSVNADDFVDLVVNATKGPFALVRYFIARYGFFRGLKELKKTAANINVPFTGFATEAFHTAAPLACGDYAMRVSLRPVRKDVNPKAHDDFAADLRERLAREALVFDLQAQFFVDETTTPIEDGSVNWTSPYVTLARLTLPMQSVSEADAAAVERLSFDPWGGLAAHRPLGNIMRARKSAYFASEQARGAL